MLSVTMAVLVWKGLLDEPTAQKISDRLGGIAISKLTIADMVRQIEDAVQDN
jgi:hypothetical protein